MPWLTQNPPIPRRARLSVTKRMFSLDANPKIYKDRESVKAGDAEGIILYCY